MFKIDKSTLNQTISNFSKIERSYDDNLYYALTDTAEYVLTSVADRIPVVSGVLKGSGATFENSRTDIDSGYNTVYAKKVNYTSKNNSGYFTDWIEANGQTLVDFFEKRFTHYDS